MMKLNVCIGIASGALACTAGSALGQASQGAQQRSQSQQQAQQRQQSQQQAQQRPQRQSRQQAQTREQMDQGRRVVIGEVTDIRDIAVSGSGDEQHRLMKVTANDRTVVVDVGPVREASLGVQEGDRIMAVGNSARIGGMPVIYARYVGEVFGSVPLAEGEKTAQGGQQSRANR